MHSPTNGGQRSRLRSRSAWETGLVVGALLLLLNHTSHIPWGDGWMRFLDLQRLLEEGRFSDDKYSLMGPLLAAPLWYLGQHVASPIDACSLYNLLLLAVSLVLVWRILKDTVHDGIVRRFVLLLALGSMFPFHQRTFHGEVFTALSVMLGLALVCIRHSAWGWLLIVVAAVNIPATAAATALVVGCKAARDRRLSPLLSLPAIAALVLAENWLKRGSPWVFGYEGELTEPIPMMPFSGRGGFGYPLLFGLVCILFSFGKGLFWYAPGLLLPTRVAKDAPSGVRELQILSLVFVAGLALLYANWGNWGGDWFWGPRYLLYASVPASLALAYRLEEPGSAIENAATLVVLILSLWVGLDGAIFGLDNLHFAYQDPAHFGYLPLHVPEYSALLRPFVVRKPIDASMAIAMAYYALVLVTLAGPTAIALSRQLAERARAVTGHLAALQAWRF